ncbi:uncharacterized protein TRUGW13939_10316 [Talaromyces rugulosus]|uniref:Carrier domain-containing protein n=1 Tax=Talaromyces rugulosus TaxID=121627 RepID=A0A7H8RAL5_TALRU|nr:uncharacterized protein TRUGW13939_10316 [Talaromyces rugulosus]QKX63147.1 hypothetical protein TRUGW13939_10316 [Talaromyces rugulosus]
MAASSETRIPIGRALPGYHVHLVDDDMQPVPLGWPGQILVSGAAVAAGYLNNESLTREKFIINRSPSSLTSRGYLTGDMARMLTDGSLVYIGRIESDSQIKLRGIRIELNDIAASIIKTSDGVVANAAVVVRDAEQNSFLVAYVVFSANKAPSDPAQYLEQLLPELPLPVYMRPAQGIPLDRLPMSASGKLDRKALSALELPSNPIHTPASKSTVDSLSQTEHRLKGVWDEALGHTGIPITKRSNFFATGGNSLLLLKVQAGILQEFGQRIALTELFRASTLASLATTIESSIGTTAEDMTDQVASSSSSINWLVETDAGDLSEWTKPQQMAILTRNTASLTVVVSGATGFLGRAIVNQLQELGNVSQIHCVAVRNLESDAARLLEQSTDKVVLHAGDLSLPFLGMLEEEARLLFSEADVIIHNGADVSFMKPYESLRAPNLGSTKEFVRLVAPRQVPFHFVSTAGVGLLAGKDVVEECTISSTDAASSLSQVDGYIASKWASETYLENATHRTGLPVQIYRPSSITGDGAPALDILHNVLQFSRQMRAVPEMTRWRGHLDLVDVHLVARGLVHRAIIAEPVEESRITVLHLSGEQVIPVEDAKQYLEKETGYRFRILSIEGWVVEAERLGLHPLVGAYLRTIASREEPIYFPRLQTSMKW